MKSKYVVTSRKRSPTSGALKMWNIVWQALIVWHSRTLSLLCIIIISIIIITNININTSIIITTTLREDIWVSFCLRLGQSTFHTKSLFNNNSVNIIGIIIVNNLTLRLLKFMFVGLTKYPPILREDIWVRFWRPWSIYLSHKSPHTFIVGLFNNNINIMLFVSIDVSLSYVWTI